MWDNFKYTLLSIVRNPALLFWPLGFPIILSTLFSFMFANLDESFQLQPVALGVVQDETYESAFGLDDTLRSFDGSAADSEQHFFDLTYYAAEDEAETATAEGAIDGYVIVADGAPVLRISAAGLSNERRLNLTTVTMVLDGYVRVLNEIETVMEEDPTLLLDDSAQAMVAELVNQGSQPTDEDIEALVQYVTAQGTPDVIAGFQTDAVRTEKLKLTKTDPDSSARYYYALLGMAAGMGMHIAYEVVSAFMAQKSPLGARRTLAGMSRWRMLVSSLAASWLAAFSCLAIGMAYMHFVVDVDFGDRAVPCLFALGLSSLAFCALGSLIATFNLSGNLCVAITTVLAFFAGLYGQASQRIADLIAIVYPGLAALNPVRQTAQLFYSLLYYDSLDPYLHICAVLTVMAAAFATVAVLRMRRQRYAYL